MLTRPQGKHVPHEDVQTVSSGGSPASGNPDSSAFKSQPTHCQGSGSGPSRRDVGPSRVLPRGQLVADDARISDDLTQPQLQVDLALESTRTGVTGVMSSGSSKAPIKDW